MVISEEILIIFMQFVCLFTTAFCIIQNYLLYSLEINPRVSLNAPLWNVLMYSISFVFMFTYLLIIFNTRINYKYRNFIEKGPTKSPIILYLICLPLLVLSHIGLIFILIYDLSCIHSEGFPNSFFALNMVLLFFAIITVLIQNSGSRTTGENWNLTYSNAFTMAMSLISLVNLLCYNVILKESTSFIRAVNVPHVKSNCITNSTKNMILIIIASTFPHFLRHIQTALISLTIAFAPFLFLTINHYLHILFTHDETTDQNRIEPQLESVYSGVRTLGISLSLIGLIVGSICKLGSLYFSPNTFKSIGLTYVYLTIMIIFIWHLLTKVTKWRKRARHERRPPLYYILIWLGVLGEMLITITMVLKYCTDIYLEHSTDIQGYAIFTCVLSLTKVVFETVLILFILRRQKKLTITKQEKVEIVTLIVINGFSFLFHVVFPVGFQDVKSSNVFYRELYEIVFLKGIMKIAHPFMILHNAFSLLILSNTVSMKSSRADSLP